MRLDFFRGEKTVDVFVVMPSSGFCCVCVFFVETLFDLPEFGRIDVICHGVKKLFPFCLLFMMDIISYRSVQCSYTVDDIRSGELLSEVVPGTDFVLNAPIVYSEL